MADMYRSVAGFVQFDVDEAEVNNQTIRRVTVQAVGSEGALVTITLWPEFEDVEVEKGDFVAASGKFEARPGKTKAGEEREFLNLSAYDLVVTPGIERKEREVVNKKATKTTKTAKRPF